MKNEFCKHCTGRPICNTVEYLIEGLNNVKRVVFNITRSPGFKTAVRLLNETQKGGK